MSAHLPLRRTATAAASAFALVLAMPAAALAAGAEAQVQVQHDCTAVDVQSTKDISNVVLAFADGDRQKLDGLSGRSGTFSGTGDNAGEVVTTAWVKSGNNKSGDGPGYGERFDFDTTTCDTAPEDDGYPTGGDEEPGDDEPEQGTEEEPSTPDTDEETGDDEETTGDDTDGEETGDDTDGDDGDDETAGDDGDDETAGDEETNGSDTDDETGDESGDDAPDSGALNAGEDRDDDGRDDADSTNDGGADNASDADAPAKDDDAEVLGVVLEREPLPRVALDGHVTSAKDTAIAASTLPNTGADDLPAAVAAALGSLLLGGALVRRTRKV